ncbi:MAG: DUF4097 family beta strand repeat protein [Clostridiales bacterium]|nr:DUF4097 family beta strand repeat protein [Clostridiales bacterium]
MNTIRNYLDNMFRNLPNTDAVRKAKAELLQMMEDKYEELIKEGKTDNEAVGIVISEFGNLDELADSLGIGEQVSESADDSKPILSMDRIKSYLGMINMRALLIPIGIALCICSVASPILEEALSIDLEVLGVGGMFTMIAAAVVLFVLAGIRGKEYVEVRRKECSLSVEGAEYVRNERSSFRSSYGMLTSIGVGLCILSILNPIVFDKIPYVSSSFGAAMMFGFIGLGVFLITYAHTKMKGYDRLLELNVGMGEEFIPKSDRKVNKLPIIICALIVGGVMITSMGTRFVLPFFTGVISGEDIKNTIATTYGQEENGSMGEFKGDISSIKLDLSACAVNFEQVEGSGLVSVEYTGGKALKPQVFFENGRLVATQKNVFKLNFMNINSPRLTIKLGNDVNLSNLEMRIDAGDINMKGIKADYMYGNFDAGNVNIGGCDFRKAEVKCDAGNIKFTDTRTSILKVNVDAGNIDLSDTTFEDLNVNTDIGSVSVSGVDDIDGYDIKCKVDAGIVQVGNASGGRKYEATGSGKGTIKISVDAGNIKID